jgi:hypothetical protein
VDEIVEFDPTEWEQPLGQPEELEEPYRWDYLWCTECRGFGFVKLSWYKGFEASPHWLPCQRCQCQRYLKVRTDRLLAYVMYTPSWQGEHPPLPALARAAAPEAEDDAERPGPGPRPGRRVSYATMFQDLLMGETLFFPRGPDDPSGLAEYASERDVHDVVIEQDDAGFIVYLSSLVDNPHRPRTDDARQHKPT